MKTRFYLSLAVALVIGVFAIGGTGTHSLAAQSATSMATAGIATAGAATLPAMSASGSQKSAYARIIHASPNAPTVDVYLNGKAVASAAKFGDATDFITTPPGNYTIDVRTAGAAATSNPLFTTTIVLASGVSADIVASGLVGGAGSKAFSVEVFTTDRSPTLGKARVEVIHAAPDAPDG